MSSLNCVSPLYEIVISKEEIALWLYLQLTKTYGMLSDGTLWEVQTAR